MKRGNFTNGEQRYNAVLDETKVRNIKLYIKAGKGNKEIADIYNIDPELIYKIRKNLTWRHVTIED
jgi:transposase-like protein